jgi:SAM-dependent MidA family methyltransferase
MAAGFAGPHATPLIPQGVWLERLGIVARANALAQAHPGNADQIERDRRRLCDPGQMGNLFKVMALHASGWPAPAGLER